MASSLYNGFSTAQWSKTRSFSLKDIELVKQDLLNHIYTIKGERPMMPNYGTRIPMMVFEPNDDNTRQIIETDLMEVFNYDPRVKVIALQILTLPSNNAILAMADLLYVEFNVQDVLNIEVPTK